jgi:hypothetical protein
VSLFRHFNSTSTFHFMDLTPPDILNPYILNPSLSCFVCFPLRLTNMTQIAQMAVRDIELGEVFPTCQADLGSGDVDAAALMVTVSDVLGTMAGAAALASESDFCSNRGSHASFLLCFEKLGLNSSFLTTFQCLLVSRRCILCVRAADLRPRFRYFHGTVSEDVNQPVVIDGDSLLLEAVAHSAVDWKHGGQPLTVVFFVEKLLAQVQ